MRCRYSSAFRNCVGLSTTAALATRTEHTRLRPMATVSVLPMLSRSKSLAIALQPPTDVGLDYKMINHGREDVRKQDCEHDAFGEGGVYHPDQPGHEADEQTKYPFAEHLSARR